MSKKIYRRRFLFYGRFEILIADELRADVLWRPGPMQDLGLDKMSARNSFAIKRYGPKKISNCPQDTKGLLVV